MEKPYVDVGWIIDATSQHVVAEEGELRAVVKCTRCGALVNSGGLSREKHDGFHEALAGLFEDFWKIRSGIDLHND